MDNNPEIIVIVIIGVILVFLFYFLVFSIRLPSFKRGEKKQKSNGGRGAQEGRAGDPQTCPVCAAKLDEGQLVSSAAYPAAKGSNDRLMHIRGCTHCIIGNRDRLCPVCKTSLAKKDHLISRLFERSIRRSHVHIVGCSKCKGPPSARPK